MVTGVITFVVYSCFIYGWYYIYGDTEATGVFQTKICN